MKTYVLISERDNSVSRAEELKTPRGTVVRTARARDERQRAELRVDGHRLILEIPSGLAEAQRRAFVQARAERARVGEEISLGVVVEEYEEREEAERSAIVQEVKDAEGSVVGEKIISAETPRRPQHAFALRTGGKDLCTVLLLDQEFQDPGYIATILSRVVLPQKTAWRV